MINLDLSCLGIISGEQKRALECFIDPRLFAQRKNYDEYILVSKDTSVNIDLRDLTILAEDFKVQVLKDSVKLTDRW